MAYDEALTSKWKALRPQLKGHWHALTDDDLKLIDGNRDVLASVLCERYAYSEDKAQMEISQFLDQTLGQARA